MVSKGQFLERPTLIPLPNGLVLEGLSHRGERRPGLVVLPPPPLEGGGMDQVVGAEVAYQVSHQGFPTLRFNYRGVGGSQGTPSGDPDDWLADAAAAVRVAMDNIGGERVVVAAVGASDAVALTVAELSSLAGLILINPSVVQPSDFEARPPALPIAVVVAELDARQDHRRWAAVMAQFQQGCFTVVPGANRTYQKNLPMVGKAAAAFVGQCVTSRELAGRPNRSVHRS